MQIQCFNPKYFILNFMGFPCNLSLISMCIHSGLMEINMNSQLASSPHGHHSVILQIHLFSLLFNFQLNINLLSGHHLHCVLSW